MPYKAAGSPFPLTLLDMLEETRALHKLFGPSGAIELENENAYRHAGTEYRLDDGALVEAAAEYGHSLLRQWLDGSSHELLARWIDKVSGIEHLDEAMGMVCYHDFQAVLCELDRESTPRTRGVQGPLRVPWNVLNPMKEDFKPMQSIEIPEVSVLAASAAMSAAAACWRSAQGCRAVQSSG